MPLNFNSRTSQEVRLKRLNAQEVYQFISTHVPQKRYDGLNEYVKTCRSNFNSRTSQEVRLKIISKLVELSKFQLTYLTRGTTGECYTKEQLDDISTHVPHKRYDLVNSVYVNIAYHFNSRTSQEVRRSH